MAFVEERRGQISQLKQAHQEALNALLKMRLEGQNGLELGGAIERAQRAANTLFAARLDQEETRQASTEEVSATATA
jgi:hypothetical protein